MLYTWAWFKSTTGPWATQRVIHTEEHKSFALQSSVCVYVFFQCAEKKHCLNSTVVMKLTVAVNVSLNGRGCVFTVCMCVCLYGSHVTLLHIAVKDFFLPWTWSTHRLFTLSPALKSHKANELPSPPVSLLSPVARISCIPWPLKVKGDCVSCLASWRLSTFLKLVRTSYAYLPSFEQSANGIIW